MVSLELQQAGHDAETNEVRLMTKALKHQIRRLKSKRAARAQALQVAASEPTASKEVAKSLKPVCKKGNQRQPTQGGSQQQHLHWQRAKKLDCGVTSNTPKQQPQLQHVRQAKGKKKPAMDLQVSSTSSPARRRRGRRGCRAPAQPRASTPRPDAAMSKPPNLGIYIQSPGKLSSGLVQCLKPVAILPTWASWDSLAITVLNAPPGISTYALWRSFSRCGNIYLIEIFNDTRGNQGGKVKIVFRPPPRELFWEDGKQAVVLDDGQCVVLRVFISPQKEKKSIPSPVDPAVFYPPSLEIPVQSMAIGTLIGDQSMLVLRSIDENDRIRFSVDLFRREVNIFFTINRYDSQLQLVGRPRVATPHNYRVRIPFVQLCRIFRTVKGKLVTFMITLESPPLYHRKLLNLASTFTSENVWRESDCWFRQTDIVHNPADLMHATVALRKPRSIINIGRWMTYRLIFENSGQNSPNLELLYKIVKDFNIEIVDINDFKIQNWSPSSPLAWQWIDPPINTSKRTSSLEDLAADEYTHIPFDLRYQLEVCLSHGYLSEYTINKEFITKLLSIADAKDLLEYIASEKEVYHNPMKIFDIPFYVGATHRKIPKYCCYMRSARVTPTTIYYSTPSVDISNRVIRHYIEYADRFLRIRFTDEKLEGRINSTYTNSMDEVFTRIKRTMMNGISIGGRRYEFLAFGNSQFREHGAYFFASLPHITAANIRAWMGHFTDIKSVAKYAARLGQCFSTTRAVTGCPVTLKEIDDIERHGFTFSDGVGRISKFLAQMIVSEFKLQTPLGEPPSVFQFRLGGCKGILTLSPKEAQGREVHIRKSQYKFPAIHNGLEVIRHSQYTMANLNRQLIIVLSSLGVPDGTFIQKLRSMLENLEEAIVSETKAMFLLQKYVDPNQMTLKLAHMVHDGFHSAREPFVISLLELWRAWQIKYLKEKAKIVIENGACLFGCLDETATLNGYDEARRPAEDASYEEKVEALPQIFTQIFRADDKGIGEYRILTGPCIVARNPSLHPGDIRVVNAVDVEALHHLRDVIVFPQTGARDIPSTCSGGDLDGDDYIVIWDQDLLPKDWFREPMDYSAPSAPQLTRDVTVNDITSFFVTYMKNDRLPQIAHAHLALADYLDNGVEDERCIQLAHLHSAAVDFNKSGLPAKLTRDLIPRKWPHFMEKKYKPKEAQYVSRKILGQLYDIVERKDFHPELEASFDERILSCATQFNINDELLNTAKEMKKKYDADMRRIMAQHEIQTEFEVWSTFVLGHANMSKDYKFHEELGQISSALRDRHLTICYEKAGGKDFTQLAPLAIAMYKVTSEEMQEALARSKESKVQENHEEEGNADDTNSPTPGVVFPLISFPWVLQPLLGKIANRHFDSTGILDIAGKLPTWSLTSFQELASSQKLSENKMGAHDVETASGIQPSGEMLALFKEEDLSYDPFSALGEAFDRIGTDKHVEVTPSDYSKQPNYDDTNKIQNDGSLIDLDADGISFFQSHGTTPEPGDIANMARADSCLMDADDELDYAVTAPNRIEEECNGTQTSQEKAREIGDAHPLPVPNRDGFTEEGMMEVEDIVERVGQIRPSAVDHLEALLGC
ncbi:hypothetical protein FQN57_002252 [Myotisia sp. PD_48]|nr:hypothetical protein FQN57_002252 [Myotisia sp. PD_48]